MEAQLAITVASERIGSVAISSSRQILIFFVFIFKLYGLITRLFKFKLRIPWNH